MVLDKTRNELTALAEQYPGVTNAPSILFILLFAIFLFSVGYRRTPSFLPGQLGRVLTACVKSGCYLMV
jgi:hypothetical protein